MNSEEKVVNQVGKPVSGAAFYDREATLDSVFQFFQDHNNLLLLAPRRVGKTSLMVKLREEAETKGFSAIFVSFADATTETQCLKRLLQELRQHSKVKRTLLSRVGDFFKFWKRRLKSLSILSGSIELNDDAPWTDYADDVEEILNSLPGRWLFLIDELPVFVLRVLSQDDQKIDRIESFLHWMRELRGGPNANAEISWLLAGSIGLDTVTSRVNLGDTINDLYPITDFGPFESHIAVKFLSGLAANYNLDLSEEVINTICDRVEWLIPYHLNLMFAEIRGLCSEENCQPTLEMVDEAFENLLSPAKRMFFDFWRQRLEEELGEPHNSQALAMINVAAKDPDGVEEQTLRQALRSHQGNSTTESDPFDYLMQILISDGYFVQNGTRYRFRSVLLREFWLRRICND